MGNNWNPFDLPVEGYDDREINLAHLKKAFDRIEIICTEKNMRFFIDVHSKKPYPANALSNFFPHWFEMDGLEVSCMEAFLQSTKCPDKDYQKVICQKMTAKEAKAVGSTFNWQRNGKLNWQGHQFSRYSMEYWRLLLSAYGKLCEVPTFQRAILHSGHAILLHSVGRWFRKETCLTTWEFLFLLNWCRIVIRKKAITK